MRIGKIVGLIILGICVGIAGFKTYQDGRTIRVPASAPSPGVFQEHNKQLRPISVLLKMEKDTPTSAEQEAVLVGRITVNQNIDGDVSYEWNLPKGTSVVEGNLSDSLAGIHPGQTVEVKLTVTGFSKEAQSLVALQSSVMKGNTKMSASAVLPSRPEDTWESVAPEMKKAADEREASVRGK